MPLFLTDDQAYGPPPPPELAVAEPAVSSPPYAADVGAGLTPNPTYTTPEVLTLAPAPSAPLTPAPPLALEPMPPYAAGVDAALTPNPTYGTPAALTLAPSPSDVTVPPYAAGVDADTTPNPTYQTPSRLTLALGFGPAVPSGPDDFADAEREALANDPDLSDLAEFELVDPFGERTLAVSNPPLKGGGALTAIAQACSTLGVDALAAVANALHEGASGAIGDQGTAYGPFQIHATDGRLPQFAKKGKNNLTVNAWAWSQNGIDYAVRSMVSGKPSARGLRGHAAVHAIVYGFERPADEKGAYRTRAAEYDHLVSLGAGWAQYAAAQFHGPQAGGGVDTVPIRPPADDGSVYVPAGVNAQWKQLIEFFATGAPRRHHAVKSFAATLKGVFD